MPAVRWSLNVALIGTIAVMVLYMPGAIQAVDGHNSSVVTAGHSTSGAAFHPASTSSVKSAGALKTPAVTAHRAAGAASTHPGAAPIAPIGLWNNSAGCQARQASWDHLFGDINAPTDVRHTEQSPCYIGHDEPGLNFVSNQSYAGSRVQFVIQLPAAGTYTGSAFDTMWVGMWLAGVHCSYRGQSYLEIQINPPDNDIGLTSNPNWTIQAPVWDLVPVGSCDPQCQNDTAVNTIGGVNYCEDDAALSGIGTYTATGWGNFAPGDQLVVTMVGAKGSTNGLHCYVNDTTDPTQNLNWTYDASISASGLPLTPYYNTSGWSEDGWGYGLNIEATWENCPHMTGPVSCNSYNGPAVSAVSVPTFTSATFWNTTTLDYTNPYPWTAATTSAGACSGYAAPCLDYTTYGGTGFYPYWSLHAFQGQAWWTYGGAYPNEVNNWGQAAQFNPFGFIPTWLDPTSIYRVEAAQTGVLGGPLAVNVSVADPNGVQAVQIGGVWCDLLGAPSQFSASAVLAGGPFDTTHQGTWSASIATNNKHGTMNFWVRAQSVSGVWTSPVWGSGSISGATGCSVPAPATPTFGLTNITPVGGGYNLTWSETGLGIANYTIWFNATTNGTPFSVDVQPMSAAFVNLYWDNQSFNISIVAWDDNGAASVPTPWVTAPATLFSLAADISAPSGTLWVNGGPVSFTANATNGVGPFTYRFIFGDGTVSWWSSPNSSLTVTHDYGSYFGGARANVSIWDSLGDAAFSGRHIVLIQATPLGVPQSMAGGDGFAQIDWVAPLSPAAPVTFYTVYYTQNPDWAWALTQFWPYNYTAPYDTFLWNTTATTLRVPIANGATLYAQVVAWNSYREGLLPEGSPILAATAAALTVGPVNANSGGPAPYTDMFSAHVSAGTNDSLTSASYSFSGGAPVAATIDGAPGSYWLNVTYTFPSPGPATATVTATDQFSVSKSASTTVFVGAGAAPSVTVSLGSGPYWVGSPVGFTATATGGSGTYTYSWNFGDLSTAAGVSVNHTYTTAGEFGTALTTDDSVTGGRAVTFETVTVYALPQVWISSTHGSNGDLSYAFSAASTGGSGGLTYAWTFGDGTTGAGSPVTHTFGSAGTYNVTVTATDPAGKTASSQVIVQTPGSTSSNGITLSGNNGALVIGLAILVLILLLVALYLWARGRRPPVVMAPEAPAGAAKPPE